MFHPAIEITLVKVGNKTVEDPSTEDGRKYQTAFHAAATTIPGCVRGSWGRSDKYPDTLVHFLDYENRRYHDVHKEAICGPTPPILLDVQSEEQVYVIHPNTNNHQPVYYAPYTTVTFFWGIREEQWQELSRELFAAVSKSDACTGIIYGEIEKPILSDPTGLTEVGSGVSVIMAAGWKSKDQHDRDFGSPRVQKAWAAIQSAVEKAEDWGTSLTVTENTGHIHRFQTPLPLKDRSDWLPAVGIM